MTLPGSLTPGALAVDWVGDKLYVVDILGQKIDVFEILGRYHAIVLSNNITAPQDIGLDPTFGYEIIQCFVVLFKMRDTPKLSYDFGCARKDSRLKLNLLMNVVP